jgi:hypothetical protein
MGIAQETVAEDSEGAWRIAKSARGLGGGEPLDIIGAKSLVLALLGMLRAEEKAWRIC